MSHLPALAALLALAAASTAASAQTSIGTMEAASATVSGTLSLAGGQAMLGANAIITARNRTATLSLSRGGEVLVCSTSALHAARGGGSTQPAPLLFALDHGAVEVHMAVTAFDTILTPDLRFSIATSAGQPAGGLLDLSIRVAVNGDTCVQNRGKASPTLEVTEQFGSGLYQIRPNQHVLFEHGSLREVVDDETSPCGCPAPPVLSASNSGLSTDVTRAARPGARVADDPDEVRPHTPAELQHPFPDAESQGLTTSSPAASVPQAPPGQTHAQVAATLAYPTAGSASNSPGSPAADAAAASPGAVPAQPSAKPSSASAAAPAATPPPPITTTAPPPVNDKLSDHEVAQSPLPPPAPPPRTIARRVGHFFRHLFGAR